MSNKLKKFLEDSVKTHLEKAYEEKQMDVNGVYSPIEFILSETEQEKVNVKIQEINDLFNSNAKADEYEAKAKAFDEVMNLYVNGSNKYLLTKRHTLDVFIEDVAEILKPFTDEYESGEPYVKK